MSAVSVDDLRRGCTDAVRMWLTDDDDEDPDAFLVQRYGRREALALAAEGPDEASAGEVLRAWFTDRLTVDPGLKGAFAYLAADLIGVALDLVDWPAIVRWVRAGR